MEDVQRAGHSYKVIKILTVFFKKINLLKIFQKTPSLWQENASILWCEQRQKNNIIRVAQLLTDAARTKRAAETDSNWAEAANTNET